MQSFFVQYLIPALVLLVLAIALTVLAFRRRMFDLTGVYREDTPAHPERIRQQHRRRER